MEKLIYKSMAHTNIKNKDGIEPASTGIGNAKLAVKSKITVLQ